MSDLLLSNEALAIYGAVVLFVAGHLNAKYAALATALSWAGKMLKGKSAAALALGALILLSGAARADEDRYVLIDGRVQKLEAKAESTEKKIADLEKQILELRKGLAVGPVAAKGEAYDPYRLESEESFDKAVDRVSWGIGLTVGPVIDPFTSTYRIHYSAPSGFRGLSDGVYLATKPKDGAVRYELYKGPKVGLCPCVDGCQCPVGACPGKCPATFTAENKGTNPVGFVRTVYPFTDAGREGVRVNFYRQLSDQQQTGCSLPRARTLVTVDGEPMPLSKVTEWLEDWKVANKTLPPFRVLCRETGRDGDGNPTVWDSRWEVEITLPKKANGDCPVAGAGGISSVVARPRAAAKTRESFTNIYGVTYEKGDDGHFREVPGAPAQAVPQSFGFPQQYQQYQPFGAPQFQSCPNGRCSPQR